MQKSFRLLVVALLLSLTALPCSHAEQTGANPHPQAAVASSSTWDVFVYTVRAYLGL